MLAEVVSEEKVVEKANILIVDDLPEKRLILQTVLQDLGQNLIMAQSGAEALREVLRNEFAVILLDVNMPDIDGLETASLIRRYRKSAHTPIIFITAYADDLQTARGYSLGAVDYIFSPVVPDVLRSKVKVFVDLYQLQRQMQAQTEADVARRAAEANTLRFNFLSEASHLLSGSLDLEVSARRLVELVAPSLAPLVVLALKMTDDDDRLLVRSAWALREADALESSSHADVPPALSAALRRTIENEVRMELRAESLRNDALKHWPAHLQSAVVVPLCVGDDCIGALAVATDSLACFDPADVALLEQLAGRAAIAFENARLYNNLQREIVERQQVEARLEDANRRKDEFLAMLSHELRNPLAPIKNAVELMRRGEKIALACNIIERQVGHLTHLVEELLDVARIAQGKVALSLDKIELSSVIMLAVETVRPLIEARKHQLRLNISATPIWISGDLSRLAQVVGNLLNNAAKYTPDGGHIELVTTAANGRTSVIVRDNGIGIESDLLPRIFELFAQGYRTLDRSDGGLGVGLTLVQKLVELHGGAVEASSKGANQGAQFKITLPCLEMAMPVSPAVIPSASCPVSLRILVVDDNHDAAETLALFIGMDGHEVRTASDGFEALEYAEVFVPQIVLLDIGLPQMSGYEVARQLRNRSLTKDALLIALTGYGQREDIERAMDAGFQHHFVKPANPHQIVETIGRWQASRLGLVAS